MSIIEEMHTARKARLVRLGIPPSIPFAHRAVKSDSAEVHLLEEKLVELQRKLTEKSDVISELHGVIVRQRELIMKFADEHEAPSPRVNDILMVVADYFNVTKQVLIGEGRTNSIVLPRQITYYLSRCCGHSLPKIGTALCKDHSTVLYGAEKVQQRLAAGDAVLASRIEEVQRRLDTYVCARVELSRELLRA